GSAWARYINLLDTFRMPLFFFASGLVSAKLLTQTFREIWWKRVSFFLYLYVVWAVVRTVYGHFVHPPTIDPDWRRVLLIFVQPHDSLWFLYALALFSVAVWVVRKAPAWAVVSLAGVVSFAVSSGFTPLTHVAWVKTASYVVFFVLGIYLRRLTLDAASRLHLLPALIIVAGYVVVAYLRTRGWAVDTPGSRLLIGAFGVAAGVAVSVWLAKWKAFDWVAYLGRNTLPIYLVHFFPILAISVAVAALPRLQGPGVALIVPAVAAVSIGLSLLAYRVLRGVPGVFDTPWDKARLAGRDTKATSSQTSTTP
ncbi:acyltransferase family protein, partial [Microbacterium sp. KNMS]